MAQDGNAHMLESIDDLLYIKTLHRVTNHSSRSTN